MIKGFGYTFVYWVLFLTMACTMPTDPIDNRIVQTIEPTEGLSGILDAIDQALLLDRTEYNGARIKVNEIISIDITDESGLLYKANIDTATATIEDIIEKVNLNFPDPDFSFEIYEVSMTLIIEEASITATSDEIASLEDALSVLDIQLSLFNDNSEIGGNISLDTTEAESKITEDNPIPGKTLQTLTVSSVSDLNTQIQAMIDGSTFDDASHYGFNITFTQNIDLDDNAGSVSVVEIDDFKANMLELESKLTTLAGMHPYDAGTETGLTTINLDVDIYYDGAQATAMLQSTIDMYSSSIITNYETPIQDAFSGSSAPITASINFEDHASDKSLLGFPVETPVVTLIDNGSAGLTMADINTELAKDGVDTSNLFFQNPGPITGNFTSSELTTLKSVCFDNAGVNGVSAPSQINTDGMFFDLEGAAADETTVQGFYSQISQSQMTELHLDNGSWNGDFRVSPSSETATEYDLVGKVILDGPSFSIANITLRMANDASSLADSFDYSYNPGELANILKDQLCLDNENSANLGNVTVNFTQYTNGTGASLSIEENLMNDAYVNTNGSSTGLDLGSMNWATPLVIRVEGDATYKKIDSSVINSVASLSNSLFSGTAIADVMVNGSATLDTNNKDFSSKHIDSVLFDVPVNSDLSNAIFDGDIVFNDGIAGSSLNNVTASGDNTQAFIINGSVAGVDVTSFGMSGTMDLQGASGQMTGLVDGIPYLRADAPDTEATFFANITNVASAVDSNSYQGGKTRSTVLGSFNSTYGTSLVKADVKEDELKTPLMMAILNNKERMV